MKPISVPAGRGSFKSLDLKNLSKRDLARVAFWIVLAKFVPHCMKERCFLRAGISHEALER